MPKKRKRPATPEDPWKDMHGQHKPTPERRAKGEYHLAMIGRNESLVAIDKRAHQLDRCWEDRKISTGQRDAGVRFTWLYHSVRGSAGPRSCLDFTPRGRGESESEYRVRLSQEWRDVLTMLGEEIWCIMLDVCVFNNSPGPRSMDRRRWVKFTQGLEDCRKMWGFENEVKE